MENNKSEMQYLQGRIIEKTKHPEAWQLPTKFNLGDRTDCNCLASLIDNGDVLVVHDVLPNIADELFDIKYPDRKGDRESSIYQEHFAEFTAPGLGYGFWFYFNWSKELIRYPEINDLRALRTSRNKNLICREEQDHLYGATVAVFGLSVGSNVVDSLLLSGVGGKIIIADMDTINTTNLNRIRAPFSEVNGSKVDYVAKLISKTDPYIEQVHLREGVTKENLNTVVLKNKPDILIDEVDDIQVKVAIRDFAKEQKIPVVMATDVGEISIVDIERHDIEDAKLFHGRLNEDAIEQIFEGKLDQREMGLLIAQKFIGLENISEKTMSSLQEVGTKIPSWPQLGETAVLGGVAVSNLVRKILIGEEIASGRHIIQLK